MRNRIVLAVLLVIALGSSARAQNPPIGGSGGNSGNSSLTKTDFLMRLDRIESKTSSVPLTAYEQRYYFNQARCQCGVQFRLILDFSTTGVPKKPLLSASQGTVRVISGPSDCVSTDPAARTTVNASGACREITTVKLTDLARRRREVDISITDLAPVVNGQKCPASNRQAFLYLWVDQDSNDVPDMSDAPNVTVSYDGEPPSVPANVQVRPGNEALQVSWSPVTSITDLAGYVVFCSREGVLPVFKDSGFDNQYLTKAALLSDGEGRCPAQAATAPQAQTTAPIAGAGGGTGGSSGAGGGFASGGSSGAGGGFASGGSSGAGGGFTSGGSSGVAGSSSGGASPEPTDENVGVSGLSPTQPFVDLDPANLCSGLITTQTSTRISGLQNGINYLVGVAAVDRYGNASVIESVTMQAPIPTLDFYGGYRKDGGKAEGGYCAFGGPRSGRSALGLGALVVAAIALAASRRRTRRRR